MMNSVFKRLALLAAAPLTIAAAGLLVAAGPASTTTVDKPASAATLPPISSETLEVANALSQAFRNVATHVLPAVVAIENRPDTSWRVAGKSTPPDASPFEGENPLKGTPFEELFRGRGGMKAFPSVPQQAPRSGGIGSGVIIDAAGIVLTNNHVVAGGGKVVIKTHDGREFVAKEVLTDPKTDIAVLKFDGDSSLVAASIGDSDALETGDWVVALGQPFGLEGTVTTGIVSGKDRGIGITARESFIQTDAAINPGNSGGPLVNLRGEVVGINTAISSRGGGNDGIGFAVPSNLATWVSGQLLGDGTVHRSYLGVAIQDVDYELSTELGVAPNEGVAVTSVFPDTPAEKAGLKSGDVIVQFGGVDVSTSKQLQLVVERSPVGKKLPVAVIRNGESLTLDYVGEAAPSDFDATEKPKGSGKVVKMKSLGLEISELTADVADQLGVKEKAGVVITRVQADSSAEAAGLKPGMVIAQVNRQEVTSSKEFRDQVADDEDGSLLLLIRTEQGSRFVVVENQSAKR